MSEPDKPTKTPLTARETELAVIALQCLQGGEIKLNYDQFAVMAEYKNKHSASVSFSGIFKHKLASSTLDNFSVAHASVTTPAGPKKRNIKPNATDTNATVNNDDNAEVGTPKKKRATKAKAPPIEDTKDDNGNTKALTLKKKRAAKGKSGSPAPKRVKMSPEVKGEVQDEEGAGDGLEPMSEETFFNAALESPAA